MAEIQNQSMTLAASATITATTTNGAKQQNKGCRGVILVVDITGHSGTNPTLTVKLQEWIPGVTTGSGWRDITGATTTALDATSHGPTALTVYPGVTVAANAAVSRPLGEYWRYVATLGGTGGPSVTCSFSAQTVV